jgi:ribonuclease HI
MTRKLVLQFDGACEPNPGGLATYGWVLEHGDQSGVVQTGQGVARRGKAATNNVAEWVALGKGLRWLLDHDPPCDELLIRGDSQLVIKQLTGEWGCNKEALSKLCDRCLAILGELGRRGVRWSAEWAGREQNAAADALSVRAWEEAAGRPFPARPRPSRSGRGGS